MTLEIWMHPRSVDLQGNASINGLLDLPVEAPSFAKRPAD